MQKDIETVEKDFCDEDPILGSQPKKRQHGGYEEAKRNVQKHKK